MDEDDIDVQIEALVDELLVGAAEITLAVVQVLSQETKDE